MYNDGSFAEGYAIGRDSGNDNGWNNGGDWIALLFLFALFGGGFGFGGFGGGGNAQRVATQSDVQRGFDTSTIVGKLDGLNNGICDGFYAVNNSLMTGFNGVDKAICNLGYNLQSCCCDVRSSIDNVNYNMATNTCALQNTMNNNTRDIIQSQQAGTQRILDYLCGEKISALQSENATLTAQLSQNAQTNAIVNALRPAPVPSFPASNLYGYGYCNSGFNNGCGCGCGC